jgi:hypothetical protein
MHARPPQSVGKSRRTCRYCDSKVETFAPKNKKSQVRAELIPLPHKALQREQAKTLCAKVLGDVTVDVNVGAQPWRIRSNCPDPFDFLFLLVRWLFGRLPIGIPNVLLGHNAFNLCNQFGMICRYV